MARTIDETLGQGKAIALPDDAEVWIEHLMPRSWQAHWGSATDLDEHEREAAVERLGNLTLVTSHLNQEMSNGPWSDKRKLLNQYGAGQRLTSTALEVADRLGTWDEMRSSRCAVVCSFAAAFLPVLRATRSLLESTRRRAAAAFLPPPFSCSGRRRTCPRSR